jgi:hypothetical protein
LIAYFQSRQNPNDKELIEALRQLQRIVAVNQHNVGHNREQQTYLEELRQRKRFEYANSSPEAQEIIKMLKGDL